MAGIWADGVGGPSDGIQNLFSTDMAKKGLKVNGVTEGEKAAQTMKHYFQGS